MFFILHILYIYVLYFCIDISLQHFLNLSSFINNDHYFFFDFLNITFKSWNIFELCLKYFLLNSIYYISIESDLHY